MPDRDIEHTELPPNYQDPYVQLCEGQKPRDIARGFERGLKKSLQYYGNDPVEFLHKARHVIGNATGPLFEREDEIQRETYKEIEEMAKEEFDDPRIEQIALEACKAVLSPEVDSAWDGEETVDSLYYHYVKALFETEAEGRIRNDPEEVPEDHQAICTLMDEVKEVLKAEPFFFFARQLRRKKKVAKLQVSPSEKIEGLGDDINLYDL